MAVTDLYGLVLCGGRSTRLGQDKGALVFHDGKTQNAHCVELLSSVCSRVFLSCREEQARHEAYKPFPQLHDAHSNTGPMGGILSAMTAFPRASWLVLAVDMPFVSPGTLSILIDYRNPDKEATVYRNAENIAEPLCAIYESLSYGSLLDALKKQHYSLVDALKGMNVEWVKLDRPDSMHNVNDAMDLAAMWDKIGKK